mmetsp:Transcript_60910/g.175494  ORF Transcript_60910/g.175494 Transcript_60910/m.175494 type:complete len:82 (-) Transcript_60910:39-284(-)
MPSYSPPGPPEKQHERIFISNNVGDTRSRCWGAMLHDKGHEVTMVKTVKSNEHPTLAWGKVAMEAPGRTASESRKKKRQQG